MSYSDNPLTQLPTVDFNFEDLRRRMAEFTVKFDTFIEQGRKRVLQERNEFRARLGEISGKSRRHIANTEKLTIGRGTTILQHPNIHPTVNPFNP